MQWRTATADFVGWRGMTAQPAGVRKSAVVVAGRRSRRSRSPVRHASSSPQMGRHANPNGSPRWQARSVRRMSSVLVSETRLSAPRHDSAPGARPIRRDRRRRFAGAARETVRRLGSPNPKQGRPGTLPEHRLAAPPHRLVLPGRGRTETITGPPAMPGSGMRKSQPAPLSGRAATLRRYRSSPREAATAPDRCQRRHVPVWKTASSGVRVAVTDNSESGPTPRSMTKHSPKVDQSGAHDFHHSPADRRDGHRPRKREGPGERS